MDRRLGTKATEPDPELRKTLCDSSEKGRPDNALILASFSRRRDYNAKPQVLRRETINEVKDPLNTLAGAQSDAYQFTEVAQLGCALTIVLNKAV